MTKILDEPIMTVTNVKKYYPVKQHAILFSRVVNYIKAVDGVSFDIYPGETLGLVGESGCGKSTLARSLVKLEELNDGEIIVSGVDISLIKKRKDELNFRREIQMIFQDPYSSLNPRKLVLDIIREPLDIHRKDLSKKERNDMVYDIIKIVGLEEYHALRYPHEFSGGQRQRIGIARSLILEPKIVVCDEPVSALDVSVQAQILNLLQELQEELHLTFLFIAHDLSVIKHISDRVMVMYLGRLVEIGNTNDVFKFPSHPYTVSLLSAIPIPDPSVEKDHIILQGDVPSPINIPPGCRFHPRCYKAEDLCKEEEPVLVQLENGVYCACHFPEKNREVIRFKKEE
jgi:oligopeptide/dipeptide ABC transporter ATP-binding protein